MQKSGTAFAILVKGMFIPLGTLCKAEEVPVPTVLVEKLTLRKQ
jgi:hypothetical protein